MAKIVPLFSSSKGNSYYVQGNDKAILIDAGRSCKQIENAMLSNEISMKNVVAIFITHEHTDHVSALRVLAKRYQVPVYATKGTKKVLVSQDKVDVGTEILVIEDEIEIEGFKVKVVATSHDARESCGYYITTPDDRRLSIVTDTGFICETARKAIKKSDAVVIESNHDIDMLKNGTYPFVLKKRILSMIGHLSNYDCAKELPAFVDSGVKRILLAHLSEENNDPQVAFTQAKTSLDDAGFEIDKDYMLDVLPVETKGKSYSF